MLVYVVNVCFIRCITYSIPQRSNHFDSHNDKGVFLFSVPSPILGVINLSNSSYFSYYVSVSILVSIYVSLISNNSEDHFTGFLPLPVKSAKHLYNSFTQFKNRVIFVSFIKLYIVL